jgi:hypothetical protein
MASTTDAAFFAMQTLLNDTKNLEIDLGTKDKILGDVNS